MLKRIKIHNIGLISDATLDFIKKDYQYGEENLLGEVVNPIAIYGLNGSGKSPFFNIIGRFIRCLIDQANQLGSFPMHQRSISKDKNDNSRIAFQFEIDTREFLYSVCLSSRGGIESEKLTKDGKPLIDSKRQDQEESKALDHGDSPNALCLRPLAEDSRNEDIQKAFAYLPSFVFLDLERISENQGFVSQLGTVPDLLVRQSSKVEPLLAAFKGVPRFSIEYEGQYYAVLQDDDGFQTKIPISSLSHGIRNICLLLSVITAMPPESTLFIDNLDASLHPSALKTFIRLTQERKVQLVFSSHNTNPLSYLRPDQIYFACRRQQVVTLRRLSTIYPNIREVNNIEKMYLKAFFDDALEQAE